MAVTITWTGHSTFLIDTGAGVLLVDPFLDDCPTCPIQASDVQCDAILITHGHFDHVADAVSIAKRLQCPVLCAFEIAEWLAKQGIDGAVGGGGRPREPACVRGRHAILHRPQAQRLRRGMDHRVELCLAGAERYVGLGFGVGLDQMSSTHEASTRCGFPGSVATRPI